MISIKEAKTKKELLEYIQFPFTLYKDNPYWVPPLISDELETFDKTKNPVFQTAEAYFYLAYKDNKIVGRVAAIINWDEVNHQQKKKVRFGWFDVIDDIEVTKALLEKVYELGRKNNLDYVEGPMGFSNEIGTQITWYNNPYYATHLEQLGFTEEKKFIESYFPFSNVKPEFFEKAQELIKKRYQLHPINFKSTKEVLPYVEKMFDLFNESYAKLASFVAISDEQKKYFKKKSKGKLFPFGFLHLLKAKKQSKDVIFYLIGVHPDYQNKGVTAIIFNEYYNTFKENGVVKCIRSPELEDNIAINLLWKNFNPTVHCRRKTYVKNL